MMNHWSMHETKRHSICHIFLRFVARHTSTSACPFLWFNRGPLVPGANVFCWQSFTEFSWDCCLARGTLLRWPPCSTLPKNWTTLRTAAFGHSRRRCASRDAFGPSSNRARMARREAPTCSDDHDACWAPSGKSLRIWSSNANFLSWSQCMGGFRGSSVRRRGCPEPNTCGNARHLVRSQDPIRTGGVGS